MIRVVKNEEVPASLLVENCSHYDGQDVQEALIIDHHQKCYICEQRVNKDFQIEHHQPKALFPALKYEWTNLFLSCQYCNGRKPNRLSLLNPLSQNIEELISRHLDLGNKFIQVETLRPGLQEEDTVFLLRKLFNGENNIRDTKGGLLYKDLEREYVFFLGLLHDYKSSKTVENRQKVIDSLLITKEFLAFKYWALKGYDDLYEDFKDYLVWNKPQI